MKRMIFMLVIVCLVSVSVAQAEVVSRFVAVVNGEGITKDDLEKAMVPFRNQIDNGINPNMSMEELRRQVLQKMIDDILLVQEARRYQIEVTDAEVQNFMDQFREQYGMNTEQFKTQLLKEGLTLDQYREKVRDQIRTRRLVSAMVRNKVVVTDEEIEEFFDEHKGEIAESGALQVSLILCETESLAEELRDKINSGEMTFAEAAREHSIGPEASNGGNLGEFDLIDLGQDWQDALNSIEDGQAADPFPMEGGFALVSKKNMMVDGEVDLEAVKDQIFQELHSRKMEKYMAEYLETLRSKAILEIKL